MSRKLNKWIIFIVLLVLAAAFRIAVAHWLPNDAPDDGRVYAQLARNLLEQHIYSHDTQAPFSPSLIRLPGYPLFLATIYSVFGHTNNGAVRIIQALIDTATCGLVALLAYYWQPDEKKKRVSAIAAMALAAVCPFTTIYAATILTEVPTNFLIMAMFVAVTLGFKRLTTEDPEENNPRKFRKAIFWWALAGLIGGVAVSMRPDSGLFLAAVGITLLMTTFWSAATGRRFKSADKSAHSKKAFAGVILSGSAFTLAFVLLLTPWALRNWRVFHLFQPLSPAHGEMPGEFVPRGYTLWVRTWLDDESYIAPFLWSLDTSAIDVDDLPPYAFDSPEEQKRVTTLLEAYNHRPDSETPESEASPQTQPQSTPTPQASPSLKPSPQTNNSNEVQKKGNQNSNPGKTSNANNANEENDEEDSESSDDEASDQQSSDEVEMTPEIDAAFGQLGRERVARHPFRYYVVLPLKRARTMWFDTHSQYWPFEGALLPLEDLDSATHQQIWLPLFAVLTAIYTVLGLIGAWLLLESRKLESRRWLLLVALAIVLRLILFSSMENPEPRYVVEFFPMLAVLGGIAIGKIKPRIRTR
jgi:Dolichyl-phosphate-mannose-protein mannosyltransferase